MIANGVIIGTSDMGVVTEQIRYGAKALYLGDPMSTPPNIEFIKATLLMPDYNCLKFFVDGMMREYEREYLRILNSPLAAESFASILSVLMRGNNIVMYFPKENADFNYSEILLSYIQRTFGITAQTKSTQPFYDINYESSNARLLYLYRMISARDYVMMTDELLDVDIDKLKKDISAEWGIPATLSNEDFANRIIAAKENIIKYGSPMIPMMTRK